MIIKIDERTELEQLSPREWELRVWREKGKSKNPHLQATPGLACDRSWFSSLDFACRELLERKVAASTCTDVLQAIKQGTAEIVASITGAKVAPVVTTTTVPVFDLSVPPPPPVPV
jgi:hypothetical protein